MSRSNSEKINITWQNKCLNRIFALSINCIYTLLRIKYILVRGSQQRLPQSLNQHMKSNRQFTILYTIRFNICRLSFRRKMEYVEFDKIQPQAYIRRLDTFSYFIITNNGLHAHATQPITFPLFEPVIRNHSISIFLRGKSLSNRLNDTSS